MKDFHVQIIFYWNKSKCNVQSNSKIFGLKNIFFYIKNFKLNGTFTLVLEIFCARTRKFEKTGVVI